MVSQSGHSLEHIAFEGKSVSCLRHLQNCGVNGNNHHADSIFGLIEQEPCSEFIAWILASAGLPADAYRATSMNRRLTACLRTLKATTISEARCRVVKRPELSAMAIDSLMIGVTEFFRDSAVFDALRKIISDNLANKQGFLRIWSAGCSNGAELYSMAILLAEAGLLNRSILVGTDCRSAAIKEAQAGLFSEASLGSMDKRLRQKYARNAGGRWQIERTLCGRIQWRVGSIFSGGEAGPWDIILWRNMAIYLKLKPALQVLNALVKELHPEGLLVVGKAERPPAAAGLAYLGPCIYQLGETLKEEG